MPTREIGKRDLPPMPELAAKLRLRLNRCRALGYTDVTAPTDHLTKLLDEFEKAPRGTD